MTKSGPTIKRGESSGDIWTPQIFIDAVQRRFGPISVDLASTAAGAKAPIFITPEVNSLIQNWKEWLGTGLGWLNPPYGKITPWALKCADEGANGCEILLLVPASMSAWYWTWVQPYAKVYSVGRMTFDNCFDKEGRVVTTPYPKDLFLAHYVPGVSGDEIIERWKWSATEQGCDRQRPY